MAQDEKMLVPVEPTEAQIEAAVDAFPRSHPSVFPIIYRAMLSAAPVQPAAVEGAGEPVAWQIEDREEGWIDFNPTNDAQKNPATWAKLGWNVRPLYAHPSPTPAADDALRVAVEKALEPFERMWAEHGDFPPTDDRH